jgi:hypothetical protein
VLGVGNFAGLQLTELEAVAIAPATNAVREVALLLWSAHLMHFRRRQFGKIAGCRAVSTIGKVAFAPRHLDVVCLGSSEFEALDPAALLIIRHVQTNSWSKLLTA